MKAYVYILKQAGKDVATLNTTGGKISLYHHLEVGKTYDKDVINVFDMSYVGYNTPQDCINCCEVYLRNKKNFTYITVYEVEVDETDVYSYTNNDVNMVAFNSFKIIRNVNDILPKDAEYLHTNGNAKSFMYKKKGCEEYNVWNFEKECFLFKQNVKYLYQSCSMWVGEFVNSNKYKFMFVNDDGNFVSKMYDYMSIFVDDVAAVLVDGESYLIDKMENRITSNHYDIITNYNDKLWKVGCFKDGYGYCIYQGETCTCTQSDGCSACNNYKRMLYNIIDKEGNELLDKWFNYIDPNTYKYTKIVYDDGKMNIIKDDGKLLYDTNCDSIDNDGLGVLKVKQNGK